MGSSALVRPTRLTLAEGVGSRQCSSGSSPSSNLDALRAFLSPSTPSASRALPSARRRARRSRRRSAPTRPGGRRSVALQSSGRTAREARPTPRLADHDRARGRDAEDGGRSGEATEHDRHSAVGERCAAVSLPLPVRSRYATRLRRGSGRCSIPFGERLMRPLGGAWR